MTIQKITPFLIYFAIIVCIGLYSARFSSKGISEFFLGGRKMNRFVVALSAVVSGRSAWLLTGVVGLAYFRGIVAVFAVTGYILTEYFLFLFYAPKIRRFSEKHDCITIPDFYAERFKDKTGFLRILLVFIFITFMVTYVSAQLVAGGKTFAAYFAGDIYTGIIITAVIILIYTLLGGFLAVSLTDVFQAIFMLLALTIIPYAAIQEKDGITQIVKGIRIQDQSLLNLFSESAIYMIGLLGIGLGSPGNPHILVRYMSIKDPGQFEWTAVIGTAWNVIMAAGAILIGLCARAYFHDVSMLPHGDKENALIALSSELFHPFFVGFIIASVFAAIMSTADSQLLVGASSIVRDIYQKIIRKDKLTDQDNLSAISRIVVLVLIEISILLGLLIQDEILWFVLFAWGGLGAAIGPTSILALFWKKTTKEGVVAGLISGTITVFIWKNIELLNSLIYELIPGFTLAFISTVVVSLLTQPSKKQTIKMYEK